MTSIQPQLWVDRPSEALLFYQAAFGATVLHCVGEGDDIVAQLDVGGAPFWIAPASSTMKRLSPREIDGATGRTTLVVDDPGHGRPTSSRRRRDGNVAGQRRTRLAARPDPGPIRPRVGDRRTPRGLAAQVAVGSLAGMVIPAESGTAAHVPDVTTMGQMAARVRYSEGDWFAVPLRDGGFAVGLIARANRTAFSSVTSSAPSGARCRQLGT